MAGAPQRRLFGSRTHININLTAKDRIPVKKIGQRVVAEEVEPVSNEFRPYMLNRAHQSETQKRFKKASEPPYLRSLATHHGHPFSLPSESLIQITAWLDPKSLLPLERVNLGYCV